MLKFLCIRVYVCVERERKQKEREILKIHTNTHISPTSGSITKQVQTIAELEREQDTVRKITLSSASPADRAQADGIATSGSPRLATPGILPTALM